MNALTIGWPKLRSGAEVHRCAVDLEGKRVLVVEDEMLLALDLETGLRDAGCVVLGPVGNLRSALRLVEREADAIDAAILDVNLSGERVFPVAERLRDAGVPFLFATAYSASDDLYPRRIMDAPRLTKPYTIAQAVSELRCLIT